MTKKPTLPLIYSCSGCSNNAQLTNDVALALDKAGQAEMSCIAGVGGGVKNLVKKAQSGRVIVALDGCQLHCVKGCLAQHDVKPSLHYTLTEQGIKKQKKTDYEESDFETVKSTVLKDIQTLPTT
ncbi:MAG: putative zinc-binding protein [Pseudomonadales bacterium]|nr:putative zinc-binding protein [Pseudomonadales bacterium]